MAKLPTNRQANRDCAVTNAAYVEAASRQSCTIRKRGVIDAAITAALAVWDRVSADSISNLQEEAADEALRLAEIYQEHADKFLPYEKALVDEAFSEKKHIANYSMSNEYGGVARDNAQRSRELWKQYLRDRCRSISRCADARWLRLAGLATANAMSFGLRRAESQARTLNDVRYSRQYAALGLGAGALSDTIGYARLKGQGAMDIGAMLTGSLNSLATMGGYLNYFEKPQVWKETPLNVMPPVTGMPRPERAEPREVKEPTPENKHVYMYTDSGWYLNGEELSPQNPTN